MSQTFSAWEIIFLLLLNIKMALHPRDALLQESRVYLVVSLPPRTPEAQAEMIIGSTDLSWVLLAASLGLTAVS